MYGDAPMVFVLFNSYKSCWYKRLIDIFALPYFPNSYKHEDFEDEFCTLEPSGNIGKSDEKFTSTDYIKLHILLTINGFKLDSRVDDIVCFYPSTDHVPIFVTPEILQ